MVVWPLLQAAASLGGLQAQLAAYRDDAFLATLSPKQLSEVSSKLKTQTRMIFFCESAHTRTKFRSTPPPFLSLCVRHTLVSARGLFETAFGGFFTHSLARPSTHPLIISLLPTQLLTTDLPTQPLCSPARCPQVHQLLHEASANVGAFAFAELSSLRNHAHPDVAGV